MKKLKALLTTALAGLMIFGCASVALADTTPATTPLAISNVSFTQGTNNIGSITANNGTLVAPNGTVNMTINTTGTPINPVTFQYKLGNTETWTTASNPSNIDLTVTNDTTVSVKVTDASVPAVTDTWTFTLNGKSIDTSIIPVLYKNSVDSGNYVISTKVNTTYNVNIPYSETYTNLWVQPNATAGQSIVWLNNWLDGAKPETIRGLNGVGTLTSGQSTSASLLVRSAYANAVSDASLQAAYSTQYNFVATKSTTPVGTTTLDDLWLSTKSNNSNNLISGFKSSKTSYTAKSVSSSVNSVYVGFAPTDANTTVNVYLNNKQIDSSVNNGYVKLSSLKTGSNSIRVVVSSPVVQDSVYTISLTRGSDSTENTLDSLTAYNTTGSNERKVSLDPSFKSSTTSYTASVDTAVKQLTLKFEPTDSGAEVKVYQESKLKNTSTGSDEYEFTLSEGVNTLKLTVTPDDGTSKTYTIKVTRGSADATLSGLSLRDNNNNTLTLSPSFASGTTTYTASVANTVTAVAIKANTNDDNATMKINSTTVSSGSWSANVALSTGTNSIPVVVTAADGTTKTYTVKVTRATAPTPTPTPTPVQTIKVIKVTLNKTTAYVDSTATTLDAAPFLYKYKGVNYTMVPLRFIGEQGLGAAVNWNASTKQISLVQNGKSVVMTLGQANPAVGLDCPPISRNNRTFVPLRYVAQTLGCTVDYTSVTAPIVITCSR